MSPEHPPPWTYSRSAAVLPLALHDLADLLFRRGGDLDCDHAFLPRNERARAVKGLPGSVALAPLPTAEAYLGGDRSSDTAMCRLFGLLGNGVTPAEPWLLDTDRALLRQAHVTDEEAQPDGWGVGWFTERRVLRVEKGIGAASSPGEVDRFRTVARAAHGPLAIAHLRKASNPMGLPKERLIGLENSQPFLHGSTMFAHNGSIQFPRETRAFLGEYESMVKGVNDSEVLFWLLIRHLDSATDPVEAFDGTVADLVRVWRDKGSPDGGPYTGLNVIFSRGPNELWAFCQSLGEHGTGLLDRTTRTTR